MNCPNCQNKAVVFFEVDWRLIIDGFIANLVITFCPFCGVKLPLGRDEAKQVFKDSVLRQLTTNGPFEEAS